MIEKNPNQINENSYRNEPKALLLDTSYSTFQTECNLTGVKIRFFESEDLCRSHKKTNIECLGYYLNNKIKDFQFDLLRKCAVEYLNVEYKNYSGVVDNCKFVDPYYPIEAFVKAEELTDKERNDNLLYYAERTFLNWYNSNKETNKFILLKTVDNKKCLVKLSNRFDKKYQKKILKRMNFLMWKYGNENACSITLTLNPGNFRNDKLCMWETINILLNEFMTEIKKYLSSRGLSKKFIRCIEAQKGDIINDFVGRGNPHIHICLFGIKWIPKSIVNKFWPYGFNFINSTAKGQIVRYPIHYVTKYITKTYTENDANNTLNQSLVWLFNKKSFEHTRDLVYTLNPKGVEDWSFEYFVVVNDYLGNELDLKNSILDFEKNLFKKPPDKVGVFI